jgi:hypothetical protein
MKNQEKGYIILITSAAPNRPEAGFSVYSSARAGASALAKAAAHELAPFNISEMQLPLIILKVKLIIRPKSGQLMKDGKNSKNCFLPDGLEMRLKWAN